MDPSGLCEIVLACFLGLKLITGTVGTIANANFILHFILHIGLSISLGI